MNKQWPVDKEALREFELVVGLLNTYLEQKLYNVFITAWSKIKAVPHRKKYGLFMDQLSSGNYSVPKLAPLGKPTSKEIRFQTMGDEHCESSQELTELSQSNPYTVDDLNDNFEDIVLEKLIKLESELQKVKNKRSEETISRSLKSKQNLIQDEEQILECFDPAYMRQPENESDYNFEKTFTYNVLKRSRLNNNRHHYGVNQIEEEQEPDNQYSEGCRIDKIPYLKGLQEIDISKHDLSTRGRSKRTAKNEITMKSMTLNDGLVSRESEGFSYTSCWYCRLRNQHTNYQPLHSNYYPQYHHETLRTGMNYHYPMSINSINSINMERPAGYYQFIPLNRNSSYTSRRTSPCRYEPLGSTRN